MPRGLAMRAGIVLASAEGLTNVAVAERLGVTKATVGKWRKRFLEAGIQGLHDEARPGRPRTHDDEKVASVIQRALEERADDEGPWSVRKMADSEGVSKSTVQRWFSIFGVKPHLAKTFQLSPDPSFVEKVWDITALYLNPPDHAIVLAVDDGSRIQTPDRTQPGPPLGLGHAEGFTRAYIRHGTTTLFAALEIATGKVIARYRKRHRHQVWLSFLRVIDRETPSGLDVHIVCDSFAAHKHTNVRAWLAKKKRFHLHPTPTRASWLNQVERWFGLLSQRGIKQSTFRSATDLKQQLLEFTEECDETANPFVWVATHDSISERLNRL